MSRPTSRVLTLLELLQSGGVRTGTELAARLGVDQRTLRRYVEHLAELGVPVRSERGRYGGYRLERGYRLPPLMLTDAEAVAVVLGLRGIAATDDLARATAESKIRRVLPDRLAERLATVLATPGLGAPDPETAGPDAALLLAIADAVQRRRTIAIGYVDRHGRASNRVVAGYGLALVGGRWYLAGRPFGGNDDDEIRAFRLDRVVSARALAEPATAPDGFDVAAFVRERRATAPYRHAVVLRVDGALEAVRAAFPAELAVIGAPDGEGRHRVDLRVESLDWLPVFLAGRGLPFVVDAPAELRQGVRELAERLAASARSD